MIVQLYPEEVQSKDFTDDNRRGKMVGGIEVDVSESFRPPNLDAIFVPIYWDKDLTTQLAEINAQHQARIQETEPSQ